MAVRPASWLHARAVELRTLLARLQASTRSDAERVVEMVSGHILTHVHSVLPDFPFPCLFDGWGEGAAGQEARAASTSSVAPWVAKMKTLLHRRPPSSG
jgi:hypothetical protein